MERFNLLNLNIMLNYCFILQREAHLEFGVKLFENNDDKVFVLKLILFSNVFFLFLVFI